MSAHDDGGPAFPSHGTMGEVTHEGLSLRDYLAAHSMPVILVWTPLKGGPEGISEAATLAYQFADAMLEARK